MAQLKDLIVAGATRLIGAAYGSSLQLSGTLTIANTTDLSGTSYTGPALVIGGLYTAAHMEIDANEIQAKTNSATTASLYLNNDGGTVYANGQAIVLTNDTRLSNARTPTAHASTATTYGVGTTTNYGHVKLVSGELADTTDYNNGEAAAAAHTHAQYLTAIQHRYINVNNTPILTTAGTALTLSAGTGISLSGDSNSNGVVTINCTVTGGGGGGGDGNSYHTTGSWSNLTYTATAVGGAGALAFTIPTGTTSTTVALGNHIHSDYLTSHLYRPISLNGTPFLTNTVSTQLDLTGGYGINIASGDNGTATITTTGQSIPYIIGTGTTAGRWSASCGAITEYIDGQMILYKTPVAGASTTYLKMNNLAQKIVYRTGSSAAGGASKLTTHYAKNTTILLVYSSQIDGWISVNFYAASNTWRNIRLNGTTTDFLGTGNSTGALNISGGTGILVTGASGIITIASQFFADDLSSGLNGPLEITSAGRIQPLSCSNKGTILWYNGSTWTALTPPNDLQDHILHISSGNVVYWSGTSPT